MLARPALLRSVCCCNSLFQVKRTPSRQQPDRPCPCGGAFPCPPLALTATTAPLERDYRVPYKVSRSLQYWKAESLTPAERIERLLDQFRAINTGLEAQISGIPEVIPEPSEVTTLASLKPIEDMLDALICAWMGIEHLEGRSVGLGDENAAIFIPSGLKGWSDRKDGGIIFSEPASGQGHQLR